MVDVIIFGIVLHLLGILCGVLMENPLTSKRFLRITLTGFFIWWWCVYSGVILIYQNLKEKEFKE